MITNDELNLKRLRGIREFVKDIAIPAEAAVVEANQIPESIVELMRTNGYFGWSIPQEFGGSGLTTEELALANMEISQAATTFRARAGTNTGIGSEGLVQDGTQAQKEKWLPKLASGEITGCLALTEPEAGSDATALKSTALLDGDGEFLINGTKRYITNAPIADLFTVFARTDLNDRSYKGISAFLISKDTPGISTGPEHKKMGQAGSPVSEVFLKDVRATGSDVLGGELGLGFTTAMKALNKQRINLAALCIGPAIRLLDEALAHVKKREQFGKPIAEFQLIQAMLAESKVEIEAAKSLVLETARARDRGEDIATQASICKYYASEMCGRVADRVVQIFGGAGYCADTGGPIEMLYRDVRLFRLYEGTSQIHLLNIAKRILK
ncbi:MULTISPECIES: acyl-CoA dehydrogenase family protein [unclassified Polynucleobacter]|uniref:acyl-CoA dehydrogenase family protein n=1 Tax=unclassified Polynucleobacter TaxID=2640945 RepID=UPI0002B83B04|nr:MULTISPECIES: acyl-CoA dehydrogenase family protein [unclassified Polynucleobacter]AGG33810.1 acyl-CoA dehydrogenase domain-containing protein [beta proteobacterium CB]OHC09778.1 MAG: acyl-CoA dehydrogenase [Polynucleobacter sp. GWA2_45_21]